jgi:hypothetical protein
MRAGKTTPSVSKVVKAMTDMGVTLEMLVGLGTPAPRPQEDSVVADKAADVPVADEDDAPAADEGADEDDAPADAALVETEAAQLAEFERMDALAQAYDPESESKPEPGPRSDDEALESAIKDWPELGDYLARMPLAHVPMEHLIAEIIRRVSAVAQG